MSPRKLAAVLAVNVLFCLGGLVALAANNPFAAAIAFTAIGLLSAFFSFIALEQ